MAASSPQLIIDGVSRIFAACRVLSDVSLTVAPGDRIGLIGENGAGKSTLLGLAAGQGEPDAGSVTRPPRTALLRQEPEFSSDATVGRVLDAALAEVRAIEEEFDAAAAALADGSPASSARFSRALDDAERAEVWTAEARRATVVAALGLDGLERSRLVTDVSGGQRSRLALAAVLIGRPDALLLDEPSNHLDDAAVAFLEEHLRSWPGPVLFASHDRAFLDEVATGLVDLDPAAAAHTDGAVRRTRAHATGAVSEAQTTTVFGGSFTEYLDYKSAERDRWERRFADEQSELARLRRTADVTARTIAPGRGPRDNDKFIHKFKGANQDRAIARRVHNAEMRLATLEAEQVRKPPARLEFAGIPSGSHGLTAGLLVHARSVRVGTRLALENFSIAADERLLVTGANGAGKSTLLGLLAGAIAADGGHVDRRRGLRVGVLEQDVRFARPEQSVRELYEATLGEARAAAVPLGELGLVAPRDLDRPVGVLSIGQQRRVALALVIARPPHLFLLDEPTNHLSLALATDLEAALGSYPGAVVIASHDRWLRRRWEGATLELRDGRPVIPVGL
ncbi:ATP-binding cassette domain-containing protein [Agromyces atrinae]|uniref:ABC-F family ATP-binding cassette domain-containing protein n=1 Tax=Agromyces atrinae TaxID=592376 RepID=UPI001F5775A9|nr:ABC-F family ATP-binding cassette domain-containing protein [Agromyces atrinae]MCI2957879.1 ATP-binding cassette domain-containing protein [Agromyces atrinae]